MSRNTQEKNYIITENQILKSKIEELEKKNQELEKENQEFDTELTSCEESNRRWTLQFGNREELNNEYRNLVILYKKKYLEIYEKSLHYFTFNLMVMIKIMFFIMLTNSVLIYYFFNIFFILYLWFIPSCLIFYFINKENIKDLNKKIDINKINKINSEIKKVKEQIKVTINTLN